MRFAYHAKDEKGGYRDGQVEAGDAAHAAQKLRLSGLHIITLAPAQAGERPGPALVTASTAAWALAAAFCIALGYASWATVRYLECRHSMESLVSIAEKGVIVYARPVTVAQDYVDRIRFVRPKPKSARLELEATLKNSGEDATQPDYRVIVFDRHGMELGRTWESWIQALKPGEVRTQSLSIRLERQEEPCYFKVELNGR